MVKRGGSENEVEAAVGERQLFGHAVLEHETLIHSGCPSGN